MRSDVSESDSGGACFQPAVPRTGNGVRERESKRDTYVFPL